MKTPFVSIITVNYNGKKYLDDFLGSCIKLDYPKDKFEIVIVDNGSTDGSINYLKKYFPMVRLLETGENFGFAKGNNVAIKKTESEFILLINNDTTLHKDVLKNFIDCYYRWSKKYKISAVNSKLVLFDYYLPITVHNALYINYRIEENMTVENSKPYERKREGTAQYYNDVYLPIEHDYHGGVTIELSIGRYNKKDYEVLLGKNVVHNGSFEKNTKKQKVIINISPEELGKERRDFIQNAGNYYFRDGYGRDRGSSIINHSQYYELDEGQYNSEEIVPGFCGAGVLINKKAIEEIGLFDETFFMYYEDGDLSFRMKRAGYKVVYCPSSVIRHIHSASSEEWSPFFVYNVERNRLVMVFKHWPITIALKEWFKYVVKDTWAIFFYKLSHEDRKRAVSMLKTRLSVNLSLIKPFVVNIFKGQKMTYKDIKTLM